MTINKIEHLNFRNLKPDSFKPSAKVNVLCGKNAQGKTNILEALWLFTGSRSFRGSKDIDLITFGSDKGQILMEYMAEGRAQQIKIMLNGTRNAEHNGISLDSPLRLSGKFCAVIFSPEHLELVKNCSQLRRKFVDDGICQLKPLHARTVAEYKKILTQRNALLKDIPRHSELLDTLEIWDEKLCKLGAQIIFTRLRYLKKLSEKAAGFYAGISKNSENLKLEYINNEEKIYECDITNTHSALSTIYNLLKQSIIKTRSNDIDSGFTHTGAHHDDLQIYIGGISGRNYASQGQQRSAVLSLKLAEAAVLWEIINEPPVLLLDDVMSELDSSRQDYLLNNIEGMQVFITSCNPSWQEVLINGAVFDVDAGRVTKKDN